MKAHAPDPIRIVTWHPLLCFVIAAYNIWAGHRLGHWTNWLVAGIGFGMGVMMITSAAIFRRAFRGY